MTNVLAFDLGASSGRAIIAEYHGGKLHLNEIHRFEDYSIQNEQGIFWDIDFILEQIKIGIKKAYRVGPIESIAIDTWGVDFGLLDEKGKLLQKPFSYRDRRTEGSKRRVNKKVSDWELYNRTGTQILEINTLFQLETMKKQNLLQDAKTLLFMPDLINYFLTGIKKTELTEASTAQLLNLKGEWDQELIEKLDFPKEIFTEIVMAGNLVGCLLPEIQKELDVPAIKVHTVGSHDTASAVFSIPEEKGDYYFLSSGTWSLIGSKYDAPITNDKTFELGFSNERSVEKDYLLLSNITGLWMVQESRRQHLKEGKAYTFSEIAQMASEAKDIDLYFDTELKILSEPGDIPKKLKEYAQQTSQQIPANDGEFYRSIYRNLSFKYALTLENLKNVSHSKKEKFYIIGGGSKAQILNQFTANATGKTVFAGLSEATAIGNALVQLLGLSRIKDHKELTTIIRNSFEFETFLPEEMEVFKDNLNKYKKIVGGL